MLVDYPVARTKLPAVTLVKSSLINASIVGLRENGNYDRYLALVPTGARTALLALPVGAWVPIDLAVTHYLACDQLGMAATEIIAMGSRVTKKTVLELFLRLAKDAGSTPWAVLPQLPRLWARLYTGGGVAVSAVGPKDAEIHIVKNPLAQIGYWRTGLRGIVHALAAPLATRLYVRAASPPNVDDLITYQMSWA